jgi:hypothetical protein
LIVTDDSYRLRKPMLLECALDGSTCTEGDMSAGRPARSGEAPTALFVTGARRFLAVTRDVPNEGRPALFAVDLR